MEKEELTKVFSENDLFGQSWREIAVNIQLIWEVSKEEDEFIELFSRIYSHEMLHNVVKEIISEVYECGEERAIRTLLGGEWSKDLSKFYKCDKFELLK